MQYGTLQRLFCGLLILVICQLNSFVEAVGLDQVQKIRLLWTAVPDAVRYELIITKGRGGKGNEPNPADIVFANTIIYTAGTEVTTVGLSQQLEELWWQVRALDVDWQPISAFSRPEKLSYGEINPLTPLPTVYYERREVAPVYPTYAWIPVLNADHYEVQVLSADPEGSDGSKHLISSYKILGAQAFDCYGTDAFTEEGTRWWRVTARSADGQQIGTWSKALPITVQHTGFPLAALGDSVTHGGGAISNPPCDPAYDWTSYVGIPVRNLGRSGDTAQTMADRFNEDVLPFVPKVLLIMGGINDLRGGTPAEEVISHLNVIREKCEENGIKPIFMTVTPINPDAIKRAFNEETDENWQREWHIVNAWIRGQAYYVDVAPLLAGSDGLLPQKFAADGLHPDTVGKELIGRAVGKYLFNQLL